MRYLFAFLLVLGVNSVAISSVMLTNGLIHIFNVQAGGVYTGEIELQNTGKANKSAKIYFNDYCTRSNGESTFDNPGTLERSCADWIQLSQNLVNLGDREKMVISFQVQVPQTPGKDGTFWTVIMVEPVSEMDSLSIKKDAVGIMSVTRYAIQVVCHLGESGKKSVKFQNVEVEQTAGSAKCHVDLENTGERYMRPVVELQFFKQDGTEAGVFKGVDQGLFPGCSNRFTVDLSNLAPGTYKVVILADCGEEDVFGMNMSLTVKDG